MKAGVESYRSIMGTAKAVIAMFIFFLVSQLSIVFITHGLGPDFLRIQVTFSHERFLQIASAWQSDGLLSVYYRHFYIDYLHPVIYGFFLSSFMAFMFEKRGVASKFNVLLFIPFLASLFDLAENSFHLYMLSDFSRITPGMVLLSGICTNLKWLLSFLCFAYSTLLFFQQFKDKNNTK